MGDKALVPQIQAEPAVMSRFGELVQRTTSTWLANKDHPRVEDIEALRKMLKQHSDLWRVCGDLAHNAADKLIRQFAQDIPVLTESLRAGRQALVDELGYQSASPLERMLIEHVVLCWLRMHMVESRYTDVHGKDISIAVADYWERRLSAAQRRYLRACETLARVRKMGGLALQVNIAAQGGQQVNLGGRTPRAGR